jgi:hypothetical protein
MARSTRVGSKLVEPHLAQRRNDVQPQMRFVQGVRGGVSKSISRWRRAAVRPSLGNDKIRDVAKW